MDPLAIANARSRARARPGGDLPPDPGDLRERLAETLVAARLLALSRVVNATGVVIHTNLGERRWAEAQLERMQDAAGYSNLEYDPGRRGSAPGDLRRAPAADRRRGRARGQQQRRRGAAVARGARRTT